MAVSPIPAGYHTVSPYLLVEHAREFVQFLKQAFRAELVNMSQMGGKIMNAEIKIGDSMIMVADTREGMKPFPAMLHVYVKDVDAVYLDVVAAGAKTIMAPTNQFYGDRSCGVEDGFGNQWWIATHMEDLSSAEVEDRAKQHR